MEKDLTKLHKVLNYIRFPVCFLICILICFFYFLNVSAEGVTYSDYYDMPEDSYDINDALDAFQDQGGNLDYLYRTSSGMQYFPKTFPFDRSSDQYYSDFETYYDSFKTHNIMESIVISGNTYNLLGRKLIMTYYNGKIYLNYIGPSNDVSNYPYISIVNGWVISDAEIRFINIVIDAEMMLNNADINSCVTSKSTRLIVADTANSGFYVWQNMNSPSTNAYWNNLLFTNLPIYFGSSDGSTGFINYIRNEVSDFSISDSDSYFNFNDYGSYDPDPEPEPVILGQYYNYAYVDGYIRPTSENDIGVNLSFSFNDYMRLHPNEYEIRFQWYATLTGNNLPSAYGSNYFETVNSLPLSTITGYNGWNQGGNNSQFRYSTTVNSLKNSSDKSLKDAFEQIYIQGGGTANTYNGFSIIDFVREYYTGLSSETVGKWVIRGNFTSVLTKITLGCKINIVWVGGEPEQTGGKLWITYDTESGSNIVSNDLGVNFNPPEEYNPQYPAEITDSNGNVIVNSGGSNITVNPTTYSNFNAIIEYLYHIDAQEFLALAGNNQNAIQYALNTLSSTESNGFFPVLKRTFDIIPDQIWNWIKVSFAVILGGAILGISYRMVRWR